MPIFGMVTLTLKSHSSFQFQVSSPWKVLAEPSVWPDAWLTACLKMPFSRLRAMDIFNALDKMLLGSQLNDIA
jgi:hypothetical protein